MKNPSTNRTKRMELWDKFKRDYRNGGGKNWKMAKKAIKRARIRVRAAKKRLLDNAALVSA